MNFIERFQLIKCMKHPEKPITNLCLNEQCKELHYFCSTCVKVHVEHSKDIIYMKQIDLLLKRNSNVNEFSQDRLGLETFNIYREFKKTVLNQLNLLEEELRIIISNFVNDPQINQYAYKFLKSINDFGIEDLEDLREYLLKEKKDIQKNQVTLKESQSKQKLIGLKDQLNEKIPHLQKEVLNHLDCVNRVFLTQSQRIDRLKKICITDEGLSQPSVFNNNIIRINQFQIRDTPLYLVGIYQPMLYKGSYNSTNYDSQSKSSFLITYKLHLGNDLTKYILKEKKRLEHEKLTIQDGHLYYFEFKNPIKMLPHQTYSLSITTKEQKPFYTYQYTLNHVDHPLIKWQSENLSESNQFIKWKYDHLFSYPDIDQVPALQVKL
ncbi:unnamed protein product [Paramecium octaurelia]|uniref:Uncharacterized protein n=1 Tax=Paramecium octaurelia TaxID=43137 RepID=A0A8S1XWZ8_PAROT|nr:unnamed protein product [Paramecium octaurelia]